MSGLRWLTRGAVFAVLTILTQVGGLAYLIALATRRKLVVFMLAYGAIFAAVQVTAPIFGRDALPCFGEPLRMQSPLYCVLMRNFVTPEMAQVAQDAAQAMPEGTVTLALDGSFAFFDGVPLIPHLSHDDGEKLDLAFYYTDGQGAYLAGYTRSPIGYFAFETLGRGTCPDVTLTLRWNFAWLQALLADRPLDTVRTAQLLRHLAADGRVDKIFVEPPLARDLGLSHPKIRFQGCRAAGHDDHIHIQL